MPNDSAVSFAVDTSVLVYAHDRADGRKLTIANTLVRRLGAAQAGVLPAQVLGEFLYVSTRHTRRVLDEETAAAQVEDFARSWRVLDTTVRVLLEAMRGRLRHGLHFYDAQIWASALLADIPYVLTEDFEDGRVIEGVTFRDPFAPGFDLDELLGA